MKKLLKTTKKLTVKTETVRNLTETQLGAVAGGFVSVIPSQGMTAKCDVTYQV